MNALAYAEKKKTYADFSSLLKSHAKSEEKAVYEVSLRIKDLKVETYEAYEEHAVADALMVKLARTRDKDQWLGRVKVLAELVEHHIIEEENDYLPELKKEIKPQREVGMIERFITLRKRSPYRPSAEHAGVLA